MESLLEQQKKTNKDTINIEHRQKARPDRYDKWRVQLSSASERNLRWQGWHDKWRWHQQHGWLQWWILRVWRRWITSSINYIIITAFDQLYDIPRDEGRLVQDRSHLSLWISLWFNQQNEAFNESWLTVSRDCFVASFSSYNVAKLQTINLD